MDTDATALQNALDVLRRQYGEQLAGPQDRTEAQMRHTLAQELGLDELKAEGVLRQLYQAGQLEYVSGTNDSADTGNGSGVDPQPGETATGPVISMPLTQSADAGQPLITSASPAMLMGLTNDQGGGEVSSDAENPEGDTLGWLVAPAIEAEPEPAAIGGDEPAANPGQGYWRIRQSAS